MELNGVKGRMLGCNYSFLRILGFKGFLEFVLVGCGSAYPPENLLNQSGRYADLPLQHANPHRSSLIQIKELEGVRGR